MFDLGNVDYVGPIVALIDEGDYAAARNLLKAVPSQWRESVRWTVAAMRTVVL